MKIEVPADFPVKPLGDGERAKDRATCGVCGLAWDDGVVTGYTPVPSGRCPFEAFHADADEGEEEARARQGGGLDPSGFMAAIAEAGDTETRDAYGFRPPLTPEEHEKIKAEAELEYQRKLYKWGHD